VLALRAPQSSQAIELGAAVAAVAQELNRTILCFGSADLTHYGLNYGFAPQGYGPAAVQWVKEVNDKRFMDRILDMDAGGAIQAADEDQSSCSAGGPAAAMVAAMKLGATQALLVDYYTSYDIMPGDSFVGYGGVIWAG
jgi:MEMO1 family protein